MNKTAHSSNTRERKLQLVEALLQGAGVGQATEQAVVRREKSNEFPLSFAQQRLWLLDQLEPGPQYNDPFHLRLTGPLEVAALERSLNEIVRRHEALRARFYMVEDEPEQQVLPHTQFKIPLLDLSGLPANEREAQAVRMAAEEGRCEFNLEQGPLFRVKLLKLGPADHWLLLTFHHIAMDGWSRGVFLRELAALYRAFLSGQPSPLPELAIQYADFAAWQRSQSRAAAFERDLDYWKQELVGTSSRLDWPTDFPRPKKQSFRGARMGITIDAALVHELKELSRREGCTLFMVLLAAFQILALRYSGQKEIFVGSPVANRNRSETEGLIGYFLNTLVLRADLAGEPTVREALRRVRETAMAAFAHQDCPYERLVEELKPTRDTSYNPVFQVMFIFQNTPQPVSKSKGLSLSSVEVHNGTSKCDLTLNLAETAAGLGGWVEYATDLFRAESMTRLRGHFQTLLRGIVHDPDQRITSLSILTEAETQQFSAWNRTQRPYRTDVCVHELIEAQSARTPTAVAVEYDGQRLSYGELERQANQLAAQLRDVGIKPEVLVGIYLERSVEMLVAMLGILKAGGAYVPIDPLLPSERIAFILGDAQAPVLITQTSLLGTLSDLSKVEEDVFVVHKSAKEVSERLVVIQPKVGAGAATSGGAEHAWHRPNAQNLAYVIYTSGSTGKPKGVQIAHQALVNFMESMRFAPGIGASDTILAVTTLSFDIAGLELLLPLVVGGRVVIAPREVAMDGVRLGKELERSGATIMQATPTTWRLLLSAGWTGRPELKALCGGEAWSSELARSLLARCGSLWNMYGPTETTIWSSARQIKPGAEVLIGGPIANTQFHVLDDCMQPVPIGVRGELYIGGAGLARGYWRRPELTEERFVTGMFGAATGSRLYKSGDMVRCHSDGRIEFLERVDQQVKIRGYRIEIGEVETMLRRHPAVQDCVVVARLDASGENQLVAYFVSEAGKLKNPQELRRFISSQLPDYMVPALLVPLSELPSTPNGKVNRGGLPVPEVTQYEPGAGSQTTFTPTEAALAEIWREVLGIGQIGRDENFFELGGHSLMVTQAIARIRRTFNIELPMHIFFQAPTVAAGAVMIEEKLRLNLEPDLTPQATVFSTERGHPPAQRNQGGQF